MDKTKNIENNILEEKRKPSLRAIPGKGKIKEKIAGCSSAEKKNKTLRDETVKTKIAFEAASLKSSLISQFKNLNLLSFITLTYPPEVYPSDESNIKNQVSSFVRRAFTSKNKLCCSYLYVYELQQNGRIHIHFLVGKDFSKKFMFLKKIWGRIIGTEAVQCLDYTLVSDVNLDKFGSYLLKGVYDKALVSSLTEKLGLKSRCFGGSEQFHPILKLLRQDLIVYPIALELPSSAPSIMKLRTELVALYGSSVNPDLIDRQISMELQSYAEVLGVNRLEDVELFLIKSKSSVRSGYLKFFKFLKKISTEHFIVLKNILLSWSNAVERETDYTKIVRAVFLVNEDVSDVVVISFLAGLLDFTIKGSVRGYSATLLYEKLGRRLYAQHSNLAVSVFKGVGDASEDSGNLFRRLGAFAVSLLNKVFVGKLSFSSVGEEDYFDNEEFLSLDSSTEISSVSQIRFSFNENWLKKVQKNVVLNTSLIGEMLGISYPMVLKPKPWVYNEQFLTKISSSGKYLYDASRICSGGLLLNGVYFEKTFQKPPSFSHKHRLAVSAEVFDAVNKLQSTAFVLNVEQLALLGKHKNKFPDFLTAHALRDLKERKCMLLTKKKSLYKERKSLGEAKANLGPVNSALKDCYFDLEEIQSKLTKHHLFVRILSSFERMVDVPEFYYSYDADFRMRLYPQQTELSPQANKIARSLVKFVETFKFNLLEFQYYIARLYVKQYIFDEAGLLASFNLKVKPALDLFLKEEDAGVSKVIAEAAEPYLVLAGFVEYKQYVAHIAIGKEYKTGFPLILDCSGSGPQIVSLLFLMDNFSEFLNLKPSNQRLDFYVGVISLFLEKSKLPSILQGSLKNESFLILLRSICKSSIMTQLYGVSYRKVSRELELKFKKHRTALASFLVAGVDFSKFASEFIASFWGFLRDLPLFKLRAFFNKINTALAEKNAVLSWSILDSSHIVVDYRKHSVRKLDFKEHVLGRTSIFVKQGKLERDYAKQRTSTQANFIHSIDAYVNFFVLSKFSSSIFPNHDSWAVGMGHTDALRSLVGEVYQSLALNNDVLKGFIHEFSELLRTTVSVEASESFKDYCLQSINLGKFDPSSLPYCKYMVYFGT